ncbi:MAG: protein kinase family protein [Ruminococcaceae bacterium]|nr:protein kinase family protein [Oscillospiraceae bacterium]
MKDKFIGVSIDDYIVKKAIKSGNVGSVYFAYNNELEDTRAIKFISQEKVDAKPNWEQEIKKVVRLRQTEGVVHYHKHGFIEIDNYKYLYIMWDYIPSDSLADMIKHSNITLQLLINVIDRALNVFYACSKLEMQHADFHSGNILIQEPDPLSMNSEIRKVWITDFGYGTFSNEIPPMDDYKGLARIIQQAVEKIDFHKLEREERYKYKILKDEFPKYLHEENLTEGDYVRNPKKLLEIMYNLFSERKNPATYTKAVGDYLSTELIGERYDEWESLFVPKFLATDELLDRNICVLTGLRGCGKTMMFRRLSEPLVSKLGYSGISGEDSFIGFYLNARNIAEAFPWLPSNKENEARKQVINYFHLRWTVEILEWLKLKYSHKNITDISWLINFLKLYLQDINITSSSINGVFNEILGLCHAKINESKLEDKYLSEIEWPFSEYDYLEKFLKTILEHCNFAQDKAFYLFLDDFSTPMVTETTQIILNPVVFRRSPIAFFKVSTESVESFVRSGLNMKVLEEGADYKLIELGIESLSKSDKEVEDIISSIFSKRIERNSYFNGKNLSLKDILGNTDNSFVDMAEKIRADDKQTIYYGFNNFCKIWSSDIRELIKIFADMVAQEGETSLSEQEKNGFKNRNGYIINPKNQDQVFREAGGRFLHLLAVATNPSGAKSLTENPDHSNTYGAHLYDIVTAFQEIAYYDLKNKNSKNQATNPPKQARKIELVTANGELNEKSREYYRGLIRYGVFIQDYRAKSVRGTAATRLYLRSLLIPYCRLTFSKRDCISLEWSDFDSLLQNPKKFKEQYIKRQKSAKKEFNKDQLLLDDLD